MIERLFARTVLIWVFCSLITACSQGVRSDPEEGGGIGGTGNIQKCGQSESSQPECQRVPENK